MRIQKILCPTDLSLNSANGIAYAHSLAHEYGAELVVFHVTRFPPLPRAAHWQLDALTLDRQIYVPPTVDEILRRANARLDAFMQTLVKSRCQTRVALGKPAEEIITIALHERADLIIMAKRHVGPMRRLISPSTSEQVSRKALCPVLSICPPKIQRPLLPKAHPTVSRSFAGVQA